MFEIQQRLQFPNGLLPEYPVTQVGHNLISRSPRPPKPILDRVQIRFEESGFGLMVRHYEQQHWCSYILVPESIWKDEWRASLPSRVTYCGPSTDHICWMFPTARFKLSKPGTVLASGKDFWIGTDYFGPRSQPAKVVQRELFQQYIALRRLIHDDSSLRGQTGDHGGVPPHLVDYASPTWDETGYVHPSQYLAQQTNGKAAKQAADSKRES